MGHIDTLISPVALIRELVAELPARVDHTAAEALLEQQLSEILRTTGDIPVYVSCNGAR